MAALSLVHSSLPVREAALAAEAREANAVVVVPSEPVPPHVGEMRDMILAATRSGRIEDLDEAISMNELPPEFGAPAGTDPIAHLKTLSADGEGREILALLANMLALPPARLPLGRDPENNTVYVWPYLAEANLEALTPAQEVDLLRLMPVAEAKALRQSKKWTWWRLAIGADGTWITFIRRD